MTAHGFPYGQPPTPKLALMAARDVIADEKRWCTSALFEPIINPEYEKWAEVVEDTDGLEGVPDDNIPKEPAKYLPTTCTNVKVCAVGALVLVCYDGPVLAAYFANHSGLPHEEWEAAKETIGMKGDIDESELLSKHPVGGPAMLYLGTASTPRRAGTPDTFGKLQHAVNDVERINDSDDSQAHLDNVIKLFDDAIKLADADEQAGKNVVLVEDGRDDYTDEDDD